MKLDIYLNPEGEGFEIYILEEIYNEVDDIITSKPHHLHKESAAFLHPIIKNISYAKSKSEVLLVLEEIKKNVTYLEETSSNSCSFYYKKDIRITRIENYYLKNLTIPREHGAEERIYLKIQYKNPPNEHGNGKNRAYCRNILDDMIAFVSNAMQEDEMLRSVVI